MLSSRVQVDSTNPGGFAMSINIRAAVRLSRGARLRYDPPIVGESPDADKFFNTHRGKTAIFERYNELLVGPLDHEGRLPGIYVNPRGITVQFDEKEFEGLNTQHFVVVEDNPKLASLMANRDDFGRLGDLRNEPVFYPDDVVSLRKDDLPTTSRRVSEVLLSKEFAPGGIPRYMVRETSAEQEQRLQKESGKEPFSRILSGSLLPKSWNVAAEDLMLLQRGKVWELYHGSGAALFFGNDEEALAFWTRSGVSKILETTNLKGAQEAFASGESDIFVKAKFKERPENPDEYTLYRLHDCFAQHREQVRELTRRTWKVVA